MLNFGEMVEWFKAAVLKTAAGSPRRGFESRSLRHFLHSKMSLKYRQYRLGLSCYQNASYINEKDITFSIGIIIPAVVEMNAFQFNVILREFRYNEGTLRVGERTLFPMSDVEWRIPCEGEPSSVSELPKNFVALFAAASPLVDRNNPRKVL